jgi:hypothetical protein
MIGKSGNEQNVNPRNPLTTLNPKNSNPKP